MNRLPLRVVLVAVVAPLVITAVAVGLLLAWLPSLPTEIATHWGVDGQADRTGPAWFPAVLTGVVGLVVALLLGVVLARTADPRGLTVTQKAVVVIGLLVVALIAVLDLVSTGMQRDGGTASVGIAFAAAGVSALVLGVAAWFALGPSTGRGVSDARPAQPVPVSAGERVVWVGTAHPTPVLVALVGAGFAVLVATAIWLAVTYGVWPIALVVVLIMLPAFGMLVWRVRIDADGFELRGLFSWPRVRIPIAEVESAGVTRVVPFGEFGGFGMRFGMSGRVGYLTRAGEALEVQRRGGRTIVVTVDDAATAAGLLTALTSRGEAGTG